jgi:hypothetical protein
MFVKPAAGLRVLDPISQRPLPPDGAEVPDNFFWDRRLQQGDVVEASPTAPAATTEFVAIDVDLSKRRQPPGAAGASPPPEPVQAKE